MYFDQDDYDLHVWDGDAWVYAGDLQGPQGIQGEQGVTGAVGPAPAGTGYVTVNNGTLGTPAGLPAASTSVPGTMSAADKTKLDGVASGATALVLGDLAANAYYGDKGKTGYDHSQVAHAPAAAEQNVNADWNASSGDAQISNKPTLGTAAAKNIPATGNASATEVVYGSDTRLGDARAANNLPAIAAGSEVTTGTDNAKMVTAKAVKDAGIVAVTLPVKATAAELNTGTDDAKFLTSLAFTGSGHHTVSNCSVADQSYGAGSTALIVGSTLAVPAGKLRAGSIFRYKLGLTKSAAGTAASTFIFQLGTNGSTADADILTFVLPVVGTTVADAAWVDFVVTCRGPLSASGKLQGLFQMSHNLAATGFLNIPAACLQAVSGSVDVTVANLIGSLVLTTAALQVWTVQTCMSELINA
jgi:hypothetical protein